MSIITKKYRNVGDSVVFKNMIKKWPKKYNISLNKTKTHNITVS